MRPFEGVLLVEGQADHDGREVQEGALTWRTPLPIFDADRRVVLGHASAVTRAGRELRVVGAIDLPVGEYGVAAGVVVEAAIGEVVTAGLLRDAAITSNPSFEDARISVSYDHVDAEVAVTVHEGVAYAYPTRRPDDEED